VTPAPRTPLGALAFVAGVGLIVAVGLALRVGDWRAVGDTGAGLGPDAREYLTIARQMKGFYWPSYREPLHPALIRVATWLVGPGERAPRLVSISFSSLLVLVTALVGWRLYGKWPALAASAFVAVHPYYLYSSTEGVRLELYSVLLLSFVWLTSDNRSGRPSLRLIVAGAVAGLLGLTRMTSVVFVVPVLGWFVTKSPTSKGRTPQCSEEVHRRPASCDLQPETLAPEQHRGSVRSAALVALLLAAMMIAPYLYVCHRYLGDSMIWINRHATWWYHRELQQKQPGADTGQKLAPSPAPAGRPHGTVTVGEYLLGRRSPSEYLLQTLRGYKEIGRILTRIFATERFYWLTVWLGWLACAGLARSLWRGLRLPVLTALLSLLPVSFVVPLGANPRLFLHVLPLWVMWSAWGMAWPLEALRRGKVGSDDA